MTARTPVLWLCGPTAVGKSVVGWEIFTQVRCEGLTAAYVDLAQIGFCRPTPVGDPDNHRVKATNLGAIWPRFRAAGARCLIITGNVTRPGIITEYAEKLPGTRLTVCQLRAGQQVLTERLLLRGRGGGPPIPGDELNGRDPATLRRLAAVNPSPIGDLRIDTDSHTIEEVAHLVRNQAGGWPGDCG
jgi:hypothetical protein